MSDENQETAQEKNNKIEKKFTTALTKLTAVVQGEKISRFQRKSPAMLSEHLSLIFSRKKTKPLSSQFAKNYVTS